MKLKKIYLSLIFLLGIFFIGANSVYADCSYGNGRIKIVPNGGEGAYIEGACAIMNQTSGCTDANDLDNSMATSGSCPSKIQITCAGSNGSVVCRAIPALNAQEGEENILTLDSGSNNGGNNGGNNNLPGGGESIFSGTCPKDLPVIKIFRNIYTLIKYATPIILVIFGMLDMGRAVASSDESAIKKAQAILIKRIMAAVVVFLMLSIAQLFSQIVSDNAGIFSCVKEILS